MIQLITEPYCAEFSNTLVAIHRLRYRVFRTRMNWEVQTSGDLEVDDFDALHPAYLAQVSDEGAVRGSVRLLPTVGPTMIRDTFPMLLGKHAAPSSPAVWESSRFAVDLPPLTLKGEHGIARATYELFAGMIEFGLSRHLTDIITVTDLRMERILRRAGWPLRRIGEACNLGNTIAVAGYLSISIEALAKVRSAGGLSGPVLWAPVLLRAA
jgi:acyl homoserine lactone synthase